MFILEERVQNCCLLRYKGLSCRREVRFILHSLEGRIRANGADFGSALGITFCWFHMFLKGVNCLKK